MDVLELVVHTTSKWCIHHKHMDSPAKPEFTRYWILTKDTVIVEWSRLQSE